MEIGYLAVFYTIGSVPTAWLVSALTGRGDIRSQGSGNAGVMNVAINVSRWTAVIVFVSEVIKGVLTVYLARKWQLGEIMTGLAIIAAVAGTRWSIWIYGSGGRGNTLGVVALLALAWQVVAISLGVWVITRILTRGSFSATRCWLFSLPVTLWVVTESWSYALMGALLALIYLSGHNIETDDHDILKKTWPTLWAFLTAPRRRKKTGGDATSEILTSVEPQK